MNIKIDNKTYYLIKGWEHRYAISEKGSFVRIVRDYNCDARIVRIFGDNNARNVVLVETIMGKKREEAYDKITLAFDTFNPNVRSEKGKCVKILDGNSKNLSKSNLTLSEKNSTTGFVIEEDDLKKMKKLRSEGKKFSFIKEELGLNCTEQTICNKLRK